MENIVQDYAYIKKKLFQYFRCKEIYPTAINLKSKWAVLENGGMYFLKYWTPDRKQFDYAVVKKDGNPLIYRTNEHTMIIAIDCIKTAFVFKNTDCINE